MDGSAMQSCLNILIIVVVIALILSAGIMALVDSFIDKDHCIKCGREIKEERYCPDCGTRTDTVNTYDYWHRPKGEKR